MIKNVALFTALMLLVDLANAYKEPTHRRLSEIAYDKSLIETDPNFFDRLGLKQGSGFHSQLIRSASGNQKTPRQWVSEGAEREDELPNSIHHFYDPVSNKGLIPLISDPSPKWVRDTAYQEALDHYYNFLTSQTDSLTKENHLAGLFLSLGKVVHHIEDMAQPEHVRGDQHLELPGLPVDPSAYEKYSLAQSSDINSDFVSIANNSNNPVFLDRFIDYWDSEFGDGIAEYTNSNFVSNDTNFVLDFNGLKIDQSYSSPQPIGIKYESIVSLLGTEGQSICNKLITDFPQFSGADLNDVCNVGFISTQVVGVHPSENQLNERASSLSFFNRELDGVSAVKVCVYRLDQEICTPEEAVLVTTLNSFNYDAAYPFLIPKAVNYSAGLIDYFFRGKLKITKIDFEGEGLYPTKVVTLRNDSILGDRNFDMKNITLKAFCNLANTNNFVLRDVIVAQGDLTNIPVNGEIKIVDPTECSDTVIIAKGLIGSEEGVAVGRYTHEKNIGMKKIFNLSFTELVMGGEDITRRVIVDGASITYSEVNGGSIGTPISIDNQEILLDGSVEVTEYMQDGYNLRRSDFTNYVRTGFGCYGGCPRYIFNGYAIERLVFSWGVIEDNTTKTPIDFLSYLQNWYPSAPNSYIEGEPLGAGWDDIQQIIDAHEYNYPKKYFWYSSNSGYYHPPSSNLNSSTLGFSGAVYVLKPATNLVSY